MPYLYNHLDILWQIRKHILNSLSCVPSTLQSADNIEVTIYGADSLNRRLDDVWYGRDKHVPANIINIKVSFFIS